MKLLALAALLAAVPAHAQMYKCVDERGVTHYSDKPRPGCQGGKVDIQASPPASGKVAAPSSSVPQQDADFRRRQMERERTEAADKQAHEQRCLKLRREHSWLSHGGRISESNAKGERTYVDDASRHARLSQVTQELRTCP